MPPDPLRDRPDTDATADDEARARAPIRPSKAEGAEEDAGYRPPRPSQAEGEREAADDDES